MKLKLLLVEDDTYYANVLAGELAGFGHDTTIAPDGQAALAALGAATFDAVVLDRMLPLKDGAATLQELRDGGMTMPVIMLTALSKPADKIDGLGAGADDYVVKPASAAELNARLAAILRGRRWARPDTTDTLTAGDIVVSLTRFRAWRAGRPLDLAQLELKLLGELVRNAGSVLTRTMLIEKVWGYDFEPDSNIVDVHIRRLRQKLTAAKGDDPIVTMRGVGYMIRDHPA